MLKNYLKITIRSLTRHRIFSFINIIGLAVGLTVVLFIALNIKFEHSFDSFNKNEDRVFRVGLSLKAHGKVLENSPEFVDALAPAMFKDIPEVENYVRISTLRPMYFAYGNKSIKIENVTYSDSSLFSIFSFKLIAGNKRRALVDPYSIVLTRSAAMKVFSGIDVIGKFVSIGNASYMITGIVEDPPSNSDVQFDALISFSTLYNRPDVFLGWNGGNQYITYLLLKKNASADEVNRKFPVFLWTYINKEYSVGGWEVGAKLEPLGDIHLYYNDNSPAIRQNINTFTAIAIFILLIACANFVNLSTARATGRMQEVGMRKVLGARKKSLVVQFLAESVFICLFAMMLAFAFVELLMPWYNNLIGKQLVLSSLIDGQFVAFILAVLVLTGLMAGLYPALFLSSFRPAHILRGNIAGATQKLMLRKALVILQFTISTVLIVSTFVINDQIRFMRSKSLGFDIENILVMPLVNSDLKSKYEAFKTELRRIPGVMGAAASSEVPSDGFTSNGYLPEGFKSPMIINVVDGDEDFLQTFGIEMIKGRSFNKQIASDRQAYLVNESLTKILGWDDPIGKKISRNAVNTVIGEVKDFNYSSLYYPIQPLIITDNPETGSFSYVSAKLHSDDLPRTISSIQKVWQKFAPMFPFEYHFLDQEFDSIYRADISFRQAFEVFSWLAIFVALLGLLGLVAYSVELRRKEIGIRKVLGSSVAGILSLLSKEFLKWVIAANLVAWPVAFFVMNKWLENFAYKTSLTLWTFVASAAIVVLVAQMAIFFQSIKAATANPVESLRYE